MSSCAVNVPDGTCGKWRVETFTVSEDDSLMTRLRAFRDPDNHVPAGNYKRLMRGDTVVMSNTPMEVRTNQPIIRRAHGSVLINGLGLGMALTAILAKPAVESVAVVEKSPEVIELVAPHFADPRVRIINADALDYKPPSGIRFNAVWHDIWDYVTADNLPQMHTLHRKYGRRADWQDSWCRYKCEVGR